MYTIRFIFGLYVSDMTHSLTRVIRPPYNVQMIFKLGEFLSYVFWRIFWCRFRAARRGFMEPVLGIGFWNIQVLPTDEDGLYLNTAQMPISDIDKEVREFLDYIETSFYVDDHTPTNEYNHTIVGMSFKNIMRYYYYLHHLEFMDHRQRMMYECCLGTMFEYLRSCKWGLKREVFKVIGESYFGSLSMETLYNAFDINCRNMQYERGLM